LLSTTIHNLWIFKEILHYLHVKLREECEQECEDEHGEEGELRREAALRPTSEVDVGFGEGQDEHQNLESRQMTFPPQIFLVSKKERVLKLKQQRWGFFFLLKQSKF